MATTVDPAFFIPPNRMVDYYFRLQRKATTPHQLFDASWQCDASRYIDRVKWFEAIIQSSPDAQFEYPLFTNLVERLVLLSPGNLQKMFCGIVLLSRREQFRRCIDGAKIRHLHSIIGADGIKVILNPHTLSKNQTVFLNEIDWTVPVILSEGFSLIQQIYRIPRQWVLYLLQIALPRNLPRTQVVQSTLAESEFEKLVHDVHHWYPELKWLFG